MIRRRKDTEWQDLCASIDSGSLMPWCVTLFHETLACLSDRIRHQAFPAELVSRLASDLHINSRSLIDHLGLHRRAILRKIKQNEHLDANEVERVLGMQRLVGQVQVMVGKSGNTDGFDAAGWIGEWIELPLPALGGQRPAEFLGDGAGRELISQLLRQIQSGAFA